jgi:glucosamine-6-phosphate deaminase
MDIRIFAISKKNIYKAMMKRGFKVDMLEIEIYDTRNEMGIAAAEAVAKYVGGLCARKGEVNMVFAAAPSQNEFLDALIRMDIPWQNINALHMDEYIGLSEDAPQGFGNFLRKKIFDRVPFRSVNYFFCAGASPGESCERYAAILQQYPPDLILMGIGENGHIAFNDPHVADFDDPLDVKVVSLDRICREQQVNDGCFETLDKVPQQAVTLTIPVLMRAGRIFVVVPAKTKAKAVEAAVKGEITPKCPASVLRRHGNATLYCDMDSARYII